MENDLPNGVTSLAAFRERKAKKTHQGLPAATTASLGSTYEALVEPIEVPQIHGETLPSKDGCAPLTLAFEPETVDQRYFSRIEDVLAMRIRNRRIFVGIVLHCTDAKGRPLPRPTEDWLRSLRVTILIPGEEPISAPVISVKGTVETVDGVMMTLITPRYPTELQLPREPHAYRDAKVRLVSPTGIHLEPQEDAEYLMLAKSKR